LWKDRALVRELIRAAEETKLFTAVIVTADHPHDRVKDTVTPDFDVYKEDFTFLAGGKSLYPNIDVGCKQLGRAHDPNIENDGTLTWDDIVWLKSITSLPIVVKGVLSVEDAVLAVRHGAAAIAVSNHGGRQMDDATPSLEVLPSIIAAVGGVVPVLVDSGFRKSSDMIKAIALGATAVMMGRPALWGLAHDGEKGLTHMLNWLKFDFTCDLKCMGISDVAQLGPHVLHSHPYPALKNSSTSIRSRM
jgi:isopentenyl diphosphate isomerase/L-lactate dehydrogenase-like FMN-dependent dehydrogenase